VTFSPLRKPLRITTRVAWPLRVHHPAILHRTHWSLNQCNVLHLPSSPLSLRRYVRKLSPLRHSFSFRPPPFSFLNMEKMGTNRFGTKYRYYRCSKKRGYCSQSYIQEAVLARQISAQLQTISLCGRYTDWMLVRVKVWEREGISASQSELQKSFR
jgi:hypothetical protein